MGIWAAMNKSVAADLSLLLVVIIWGSTFVIVQDAIAFLSPFSFNAVRFLIAALALCLFYIAFVKKSKSHFTANSLKSGFIIGFWLFLGYAFQTVGLLYTTPAKAGFITGLSVILVPLFAFILMKQHLGKFAIAGVISATAGLYMLTLLQTASFGKGDFLVLLCAVSFAMHILMTEKYAKTVHAVPLTILQLATVSLLSFISSFLFEKPGQMYRMDVLLKDEVLYALLITSILATAFAFLAQTYFQVYTSATRVAMIFALEPVFAAITSYFMAGERFTVSMVYGGLLILLGIILAEWPSIKATEKAG